MIKIFLCSPLRRNLIFQTLPSHFPSHFSTLAESNLTNANSSNVPSQTLFLHFVTTRLNISSPEAVKMMKTRPTLGRLKTLDNVEQVVSTLKRHGCTKNQIASLITSQPALLLVNAERVLEPKIQVLKDFGVWDENLIEIVPWLAWIITVKREILRSNLELLNTVFPTPDLLIKAIRRTMQKMHIIGKGLQNSFQTSVAFWEDFGFRGKELTDFLLLQPWVLIRAPLTLQECDFIRKIGIDKESKMYKYIVSVVAMIRIEVLEARIDNLQLCGLSIEEALQVVRMAPTILQKSEENIKKKMDFMLNHIGLSVDFVVKHTRMFSMSLGKVMRPRILVSQKMRAMDGAGEVNPTRLFSMLMMSEVKFVAQIIQRHPESAALWTVYKNAIADVSKTKGPSHVKL